MTTPPDAEVRAWLKSNRPDIKLGVRGRLPSAAWDAYWDGNDQLLEDPSTFTDVDFSDEIPPAAPEKKKWGLFGSSTPKEKTTHKRVSTSTLLEHGWSAMGALVGSFSQVVEQEGQQYKVQPLLPVARVMDMQAPVAGEIFDDVIKGTVVDKLVQPLARISDKGEDAFALLGPPMIATAICMQPTLYPVLRPAMAAALKSWVVTAGPRVKKAKERQEKLVAELGEDYGASIEEMLDFIFGIGNSNGGSEG